MADKVKCPRCGMSTADANFCERCGKSLYSCAACGANLSKDAIYCPACGMVVTPERKKLIPEEHISWTWWLLPLFFQCLGGVVAWGFNRKENPAKAKIMLWFGISLTVLWAVLEIIVYE